MKARIPLTEEEKIQILSKVCGKNAKAVVQYTYEGEPIRQFGSIS